MNELIVLGGNVGGSILDTVEVSAIDQNGVLGEWQDVESLLHPRTGLGNVVVGNFIYVIGGMLDTANTLALNVDRANINP